MNVAFLPPRLGKEVRVLLPVWLGCAAVMSIAIVLGGDRLGMGLLAYVIGAVSLGALSIGHEYNSRTLTLLLSQPATRARLFLEKMGVLAFMLAFLAAAGWFVVSGDRSWRSELFLPLVGGLFVAPWLTMVCRNPMAGIVFTIAIPAMLWGLGDLTTAIIYTPELSQIAAARSLSLEIFWRGMLIVGVLAAVSSWWMFMRLEAIESRGLEVHLPSWLTGFVGQKAAASSVSSERRRSALWLLAKKELRLQQLTFAVSGLYVIGWIAVLLFNPMSQATRTTLLYSLTIFHSGTIPLLAGSLASAEERQLGTLGWHVLLPMASWKQWLTKAGVAVSTAMVLTFALPALLLLIPAAPAIRTEIAPVTPAGFGFAVVAVVVATLYISSLCSNGLRALLTSLPVMLVLVGFTAPTYSRWYLTMSRMLETWRNVYYFSLDETFHTRLVVYQTLMNVLVVMMYVGAIGIALRFAQRNHRLAEQGAERTCRQLITLIAFLAVGAALWSGASQLYAAEAAPLIQARQRQFDARFATVTGVVLDSQNHLVKHYTVAVFCDDDPKNMWTSFHDANPQGEFKTWPKQSGRCSLVAVDKLDRTAQLDQDLRKRLKALAVPLTLEAGQSRTISLLLVKREDIQPK